MARVSVSRCPEYAQATVDDALSRALAPLGGMEAFVRPGQRVLVKPNLLMKAQPDRAVTTHPSVVRAVVRAAKACGGDVAVGDSPGGRPTMGSVRASWEASGWTTIAEEEGVRLVLLDDEVSRVRAPGGKLYSSFNIGAEVADADVVINVPKLKTHGFMMMTGAVKNLFGCIPGLEKAQFHVKVPDRDDFGDMLVDLLLACAPSLSIMDAVIAMEGEGPSGGTPRPVGAILASSDAVALDAVAASMTDFDPMDVYTNRAAAARDIGPRSVSEVEVVGDDWRGLAVEGFAHPAADVPEKVPLWLRKRLRRWTASTPFLARGDECTACGTCEKNCPVSAIGLEGGRPAFDYDACIRCYCCQELCPVQAIDLKTPRVVSALFPGNRAR